MITTYLTREKYTELTGIVPPEGGVGAIILVNGVVWHKFVFVDERERDDPPMPGCAERQITELERIYQLS